MGKAERNMFGMFVTWRVLWVFLLNGLSSFAPDPLSVKEGQSFTLLAGIKINQKDRMMWYFDNICLAQRIGADNGETCTDDPCKERFLCRLKLDHQTGSLTITNTRTTDSGEYKLMITGNGNSSDQIIRVSVNSGSEALDEVSVIEGDSVTLRADVRDDHDRNVWYYNEIRIAHNSGNLSKICTDDPCKVRFGDRLKLDHWTASLTIMNINKTDAGPYKLTKRNGDKLFSVVVCGVFDTQKDEVEKKTDDEGESVPLNPDWTARVHFVGAAVAVLLLLVAVIIIIVVKWRKTGHIREPSLLVESERSSQ